MAADIVITKPAKKEVAIKRAAARSVVVDPSTGGGGGGGVKLTPTVEVNGDQLIFHYVTLLQMTMMHVSVSGGSIGFELTEDEDDFQLRYSQDSPQEIAGEIIYEDSLAIKDDVFETIRVPLVGYEITYVRMDGLDANLLEADINWRLSDIQQRAADLDGVAQESTSQQILTAVENIDIDTSDLAKEATLEAVGLDAEAAKTAAQNAQTAAGQAKTAAEAAEAAIQQIINAHILGYSLGGYTFINGFTPEGAGSLLVNRDKISAIDDDNITSFSTISNEMFRSCNNLTEVRYNNLVSVPANAFVNSSVKKVYLPSLSISGIRTFQSVGSVEEIDIRNLSYIPQEFAYGCSKLYYLNASNCSSLISQCLRSAPSIIDMIIGGNFSGSMNFSSVYYDPYNAYSTSIDTLCFPDDQDKYGRTFANNWEKWKWCIINHFAANLQDRTGLTAYTITFGSTVLSHFDAEMIAAFTDKNWNLA